MAYDLEEQEQLDELKAWWKANGSMLSYGLLALVIAYAAFQGWNFYNNKQSLAASAAYQSLMTSDTQDLKAVQTKAADLMENYSSTPYAGRAALFVAKVNYEKNDAKSAKAQLDWAKSNAKESAVSAAAILQLASILNEEKDYQAALTLLDTKHDAGFDGLFLDLKGDVLANLGKVKEAKSAYEEALTKLDASGKYRLVTQQKLQALG